MPDEALHPCAYQVLRYTPNLVRDEWVNIGTLDYDPTTKRARLRLIEEPAEFARVRRLHPNADERVLRALRDDFERQFEEHGGNLRGFLERLDQTLANVLQLSLQKGVLTADLDAELDRLYRDHVEPPRYRAIPAEQVHTRNAIRARITQVFRSAGIYTPMEKGFRVEEFTHPGDPLKLDFAYRSNGTRGFVHALALGRDPGQAKVLAFTAESIRAKLTSAEFTAVAETPPQPGNTSQQFVARLLEAQGIALVPVAELPGLASRLKPTIH
jgi:hypothetical protein